MTGASRLTLLANLRLQARGCRAAGSPFYGDLLDLVIADVEAGGAAWTILAPYAAAAFEPVYPLRLLGGVHARVLQGDEPELAAHYPSTGGDGDAAAAWPWFRALLADPPPDVLAAFGRAVQTNEVGRSVALVGGLLEIASRTGLPLRLREVGASAGLNLRVDRYRYEQGGLGWGDPASGVRFVDRFVGGAPPFDAPLVIADRRGCDRDPLDATQAAARCALLSFVWPGCTERFDALARALRIARAVPVTIDRADVTGWLDEQLAARAPGTATVVYHSIVWQYFDATTRARMVAIMNAAGGRATRDAPLAWLRLEPRGPRYGLPDLHLTLWPGRFDATLARAGFHLQPVTWLARPSP